jgi:hypothetical protein
MIQLDAVGGGAGYYLEVTGTSEQDGQLLARASLLEDLAETRLTVVPLSIYGDSGTGREPPGWLVWTQGLEDDRSDQIPFREARIPSLLVRWRHASEENWPEERADEVLSERLGAAGRLTSLLLMTLAR